MQYRASRMGRYDSFPPSEDSIKFAKAATFRATMAYIPLGENYRAAAEEKFEDVLK
jgi:hypothetical protein